MLTTYMKSVSTSLKTSIGSSYGFKPLEPPENWERDNQEQLRIVSPVYTEETNGFRIISPISDISNPSDIWRFNRSIATYSVGNGQPNAQKSQNVQVQHFFPRNNQFMDVETMVTNSTKNKEKKNHHHRIESLTKVFGCFHENVKTNAMRRQLQEENKSLGKGRHLVEI